MSLFGGKKEPTKTRVTLHSYFTKLPFGGINYYFVSLLLAGLGFPRAYQQRLSDSDIEK